MRSYTVNQPTGNDAATDFSMRQLHRSQLELQFYDTATIKWERTTRGIRAHAKIPPLANYQKSYFPFRIFQTGGKWRVRCGKYQFLTVAGTDGDSSITGYVKNPDDASQQAPASDVCDFALDDAGSLMFVWIDNTDTSAPKIDYDITPPNPDWDTESGWDDGDYILLGWIDYTSTPWVRQIVRTDLFCIPLTT